MANRVLERIDNLAPPPPFTPFGSQAEFEAYRHAQRTLLDARYRLERELALAGGVATHTVRPGSCALCLRATRFTTRLPDTGEPNWREGQACGCPDRLSSRLRAVLSLVLYELEVPAFSHVLLVGSAQPLEVRLQRSFAQVSVRARSGRLLRAPEFEAAAYHLIISSEHAHAEPAIDPVLRGLRAALAEGGTLVLTAPFDAAAARSVPGQAGAGGRLGWDILARLQNAGFTLPRAQLYWSGEFGHLGTFNFLFSAGA